MFEGSGTPGRSSLRVIVPVAFRNWDVGFPFQFKTSVPVIGVVIPRMPVATIFSVNVEFAVNADWPTRSKPFTFEDCTRVPVTTLPDPLRLPEGTEKANESPFRLPSWAVMAPQPFPVQAAPEVRKFNPVSEPLVVIPWSKVPLVRLIVT
jgi:hypothetical protein